MDSKQIALIFKALCDETRVEIVKLLQTGEKCACHISDELGLAQSKLSYHMKILCASGIIDSWYVGKWTHYTISKEGSEQVVEILKTLTLAQQNSDQCSCSRQAI